MKNPANSIAIVHRVLMSEDFDHTVHILFQLLNNAQHQYPGMKRCLYLEIDGHRSSEGGFDSDMFELQSKFTGEFLIQFLTRAEMPLGIFQNPNPQNNEIPEQLDLIQVDSPRLTARMHSRSCDSNSATRVHDSFPPQFHCRKICLERGIALGQTDSPAEFSAAIS